MLKEGTVPCFSPSCKAMSGKELRKFVRCPPNLTIPQPAQEFPG